MVGYKLPSNKSLVLNLGVGNNLINYVNTENMAYPDVLMSHFCHKIVNIWTKTKAIIAATVSQGKYISMTIPARGFMDLGRAISYLLTCGIDRSVSH